MDDERINPAGCLFAVAVSVLLWAAIIAVAVTVIRRLVGSPA
jgi:predicted transporter